MGLSFPTCKSDWRDDPVNVTSTPLSLNEIRFYFTRAAVGAGTPFGIGEVFTAASMHLAFLGIDPARAAASALSSLMTGQSCASLALRDDDNIIHVESRRPLAVSALYAGPVAADRLFIEAGYSSERRFRIHRVDQPLIVAGAVAATGIENARIVVSWTKECGSPSRMDLNGDIASLTGMQENVEHPSGPATVDLLLTSLDSGKPLTTGLTRSIVQGRSRAIQHGVEMDSLSRATVMAFFNRTLVPTSHLSRVTGAGTGAEDSD